MKTLLLIAALCFVGCAPADPCVKTPNWVTVQMGSGAYLNYKIVMIDGNEYFVVLNSYGNSLCPRLPPKVENNR